MPPDIRGTRRDRPARHSQHLPPSPTRVSTLATTQRTKLGVETDRSIYLSLSESERNETHAPSFDRIEANRRVKRIGGVSADRLSSSGYGTKRLFRVTTMDPRRGACSECGTPTVARPPRTRALYERETGIDRTGACACPLLRLSSPPPPPPSIRFLVLLSLSLSLRALSNERACLLLVYDRDQTDWINRKSLPPPPTTGDRSPPLSRTRAPWIHVSPVSFRASYDEDDDDDGDDNNNNNNNKRETTGVEEGFEDFVPMDRIKRGGVVPYPTITITTVLVSTLHNCHD